MTIWGFSGRRSGWGQCKKNFKKNLFFGGDVQGVIHNRKGGTFEIEQPKVGPEGVNRDLGQG